MKKKILSVLLSLVLLASAAMPAISAVEADTAGNELVPEDGAYVPGEVVVLFRSSAINTDTAPKKQELAETGADFGELMDASSSMSEACGAADEEIGVLRGSLGGDFVLEDTLVLDAHDGGGNGGLAETGASAGGASGDGLVIALVSSEKYDTAALIEKLSKNPDVEAAEPNYIVEPLSVGDYDYSLNDPLNWYDYQANSPSAENTAGDNVSNRGYEPADCASTNAGYAWGKLTGEEEEIVAAVVDSGVNMNHEDLENMLWTNPGDIGLDGEHGFNFVDETSDVTDTLGHGTHVSGTIAAQANNGLGLAGVSAGANVKLMMCSTNTAEGDSLIGKNSSYRQLGALSYILKAKQRGVNIVCTSNSWGSPGVSEVYDAVINRLGEEGILTFVAAGNENCDLDYRSYSPAGGNSPYMVSVGASKIDGSRAGFSNYGRSKVDLFAPGVNILSSVAYPSYFPSIYSEEQRSATTEYYGLFDGDTAISEGSATPSVNGCDDSVKPFGSSVFRVQGMDGAEITDSKATCELSVSKDYTFSKSDKPASLKVTIDNASMGELYYLYFPYEKNPATTGVDNTDFSVFLTHSFGDDEMNANITAGEVLVEESGSCSLTMGGCSASSNDAQHLGMATHICRHSAKSDVIMNAGRLGGRKTGIGICIRPGGGEPDSNRITVYLDSIAVSKPDAEISADSSYDIMSGTSMATPAASGAYAVLASLYPKREDQSGSEYALENRARLFSCVTRTDALSDLCVTGGYLDLSLIGESRPVLTRAECDMLSGSIVLSGEGLSPGYTLRYQRRADPDSQPVALPSDGMTVDYSQDGKTITIGGAKKLFGAYAEFSLCDGDTVVAKICDFLVKGQEKMTPVYHEEYPQSIGNDAFILPTRALLTDTEGNDLYGFDLGAGTVSKYDGVQFNDFRGTNLTEAVLAYFRGLGFSEYELRHDFGVSFEMLNTPLNTNNHLYEFVTVTYSSSRDWNPAEEGTYHLFASIDYTAEAPKWEFKNTRSFDRMLGLETFFPRSFAAEGGKIYCIGEGTEPDSYEAKTFMFSYDIAQGVWTREKEPPYLLSMPIMCGRDGRIYLTLGVYSTEDGQNAINEIYCYEDGEWKKLSDIPYIGSYRSVKHGDSIEIKGTCAPVKDGLVFFSCPVDGAGNMFVYRFDAGECEPLYMTLTGYKANHSILYSAVETKAGVYYIEISNDQYMSWLDMYLLPADSGKYTPSYRGELLGLLGDANLDGEADIADATTIQRYDAKMIGLSDTALRLADVDKDGDVSIMDATWIQRYAVGLKAPEGIAEPLYSD